MKTKINDAADFGRVLRARRKELGYTQKTLSEFTGFSVSFLSDMENGKPTTEIGKVLYLAGMLGLDICLEVR